MVLEGTYQFAHAASTADLLKTLRIIEIPDSLFLHLLSSGDIIHQVNRIFVIEVNLFLIKLGSRADLIIDLDH